MMAAFHTTGAVYDRRNRRWLFRIPRHQADSTSSAMPGKRMRTSRMVSSRFSPAKPGAMPSISQGVAQTPTTASTAVTRARSAPTAPATRAAASSSSSASSRA